ncbi:MAG: hypothetical protein KAH16_01520 [Candidatus Izimaplasma sp.]|nr:hypothetical protein [Candidatus Izimaplasma bacterium]
MTKESYTYYLEKGTDYSKKAKLFYGLYIAILAVLVGLMFIYQIHSYFTNLVIIVVVMYFLYKLVFIEFIYYVRKRHDFKRIELMKIFNVSDNVVDFFSDEIPKGLYDINFDILSKNEVYILAKSQIENSISSLGLAVYLLDNISDEISPTVRDISNELSGYVANASYVKVILLIRDEFTDEELESLKYDSSVHHNTVVIGLEKSTNHLIYNYFLNGEVINTFLSDIFEVDLTRDK